MRGILRDVYPWNFLTAPQLESKVKKETLADWIQRRKWRGRLEQVDDRITLWDVQEKYIPKIRSVLGREGSGSSLIC